MTYGDAYLISLCTPAPNICLSIPPLSQFCVPLDGRAFTPVPSAMSSTTLHQSRSLSKNTPESRTQNSSELEKDRPITPSLPRATSKDVRAYEHNRQQVKKAAELVKAKARKEQGSAKASYHETKGPGLPSVRSKRLRPEDVDSLETLGDIRVDTRDVEAGHRGPPSSMSEVKLSDLVISGKRRKGKGKRADCLDHICIAHVALCFSWRLRSHTSCAVGHRLG